MNRLDLLCKLRERPAFRGVPVVLFSAHRKDREGAINLGAISYLTDQITFDAF